MIVLTMNNKGGVGKTTCALELAAGYQLLCGRRVRGVDLDAGALELDGQLFHSGGSFLDWYRSRRQESRLQVPVTAPAPNVVLTADELLESDQEGEQDVLVLDGPIALSRQTIHALVAADLVLVPTRPAVLDLRATSNLLTPPAGGGRALLSLIADERARRGLRPQRVLCVLNQVDPHPLNQERRQCAELAKEAAIEMAPVLLTRRVAYPRAQAAGESVLTAFGWDRAAQEVAQLVATCERAHRGATAAELAAAIERTAPGHEPHQVLKAMGVTAHA